MGKAYTISRAMYKGLVVVKDTTHATQYHTLTIKGIDRVFMLARPVVTNEKTGRLNVKSYHWILRDHATGRKIFQGRYAELDRAAEIALQIVKLDKWPEIEAELANAPIINRGTIPRRSWR